MTELSRRIAQVWPEISAAEIYTRARGFIFMLETLAYRGIG